MGIVTDLPADPAPARDDNGPMADSDTHRSVLAYVVGAALGGIALALTAWVGLRGRRGSGLGIPDPATDPAAEPSGEGGTPDEDIV